MGVYQDAIIELSVPLDAVPTIAAELRRITDDPDRLLGEDARCVAEILGESEGSADEIDYEIDGGQLVISGELYDARLGIFDVDKVEETLAAHGTTGTIETRCEGDDALRVLRGGKVLVLTDKISFYRGEGDLISSALSAALDYIQGKESEENMLSLLQAAAHHSQPRKP